MQISPYVIPGLKTSRCINPKEYTKQELIQAIKSTVLDYYLLTEQEVFARCRRRELLTARNVMRYLARTLPQSTMSLKEIGRVFPSGENTDHTTIIHSVSTVMDHMDTDEVFREEVMMLKRAVESGTTPKLAYSQKRVEQYRPIYKRKGKVINRKEAIPRDVNPVQEKPIKRSPPPAPIIRMNTLSESEKVMQKYL